MLEALRIDAAAGLDHVRDDGTGADEDAFQVDRDHGVELLVAHHAGDLAVFVLDELAVAQNAGIVDQDVDGAPAVHHFPVRRLRRRRSW